MGALVVTIVNAVYWVFTLSLLARVLFSWINIDRSNPLYPIASLAYHITEPLLAPIRRVLPTMGTLDFSPMLAIILVAIIRGILIRVLA